MSLIAHMADVHLGYSQYGLSEREQDVYEAFEEAVQLIQKEHAKILLIAGDLFDSPRPPIKALMKARELLQQLKARGVEIYHVIGDHEIPRRIGDLPPTAILEGVSKHIGLRNAETGEDILLTGLDRIKPSMKNEAFDKLKLLAEEARRKAGKRIMVAHIPLKGPESALRKLPKGYSYYALGHEHDRKIFSINGAKAAYPGSIDIFSTSEISGWEKNGKGFVFIDFSTAEPIMHEINLSSIRPQKLLSIRASELEKVLREVSRWSLSQKKKPIIHFKIYGGSIDRRSVLRTLEDELTGKVLYYRHELIEEIKEIEAIEEPSRIDLRSILMEYLSARNLDKSGIELALSIYDAYTSKGLEEVERIILKRAEEVERNANP